MARGFEERLATLREAVDESAKPDAQRVVLQALRGNNGYLVSVAAGCEAPTDVAFAAKLKGGLEAAFWRLLEHPIKRDPNCYGKLAVVKALFDADERVGDIYEAGSRHVQLEPVMGGRQDTAAELRGTCVMALAHQQHPRAMVEAARLLVDAERPARVAAARALGASANPDVGEPLLRLKLALHEPDPEVLGECFAALLELSPTTSLAFVVEALDRDADDAAEAAALALGGSRLAAAFEPLRERAESFTGAGRRRALLLGIALLRRDEAWDYLVDRIEDAAPPTARAAIEALATFRHDEALAQRVQKAATARDDASIAEAARVAFNDE